MLFFYFVKKYLTLILKQLHVKKNKIFQKIKKNFEMNYDFI